MAANVGFAAIFSFLPAFDDPVFPRLPSCSLLPFDNSDVYFIEMNEYELLQAFRTKRSEEAFAELVRRFAGLVYSVAKRRSANTSLAGDIAQIVFIRFAKNPPRVRNHAELAAWLHRTTVNVTIDTWRSENRRHNREQQAVAMETTSPENALWDDLSPNLDEALNQLNDADRQAVLLRFFGQKTMRDVGLALGVSEDAAKMRVGRALDRLRTQLGVRSAACTAAVLGTILAERSVEAAPRHLVSQLAAMKLPAAAGMGGLIGALLQIPRFKLAASAVLLVVIGVGIVHLARSLTAPVPTVAMANPETNPPGNTTRIANRQKLDPGGFRPTVVPPRPVMMLFHVLDAETGETLANTAIHVFFFGAGGNEEGNDILTDNRGIAAIPGPGDVTKSQAMNVFVVAEGHVPKAVGFRDGAAPAEYTMKLDPAMTASGFVVDQQGSPVAGVEIKIQGPGDKPGQAENVNFQTCPVTNHDDGSWSCSYIPRDYTEIRFILKKTGYAVTFPVVPVDKVGLTSLVLVINRGLTVTGHILDSQHRPIVNARINTLDGDHNQRQFTGTDENGGFSLVGVAGESEFSQEPPLQTNDNGQSIIRGLVGQGPLHVELAVQAEGFAPQARAIELSNSTNIANFTLSSGKIFRGRVMDEVGNPISNAVVQTDWNNQGLRAFEWQTRTDADGRFQWDSAPEGPVLFWFEADGYQVQRDVSLAADGSDHEITLRTKTAK